MATVRKQDLIDQVSQETGCTGIVVKKIVQSLLDQMIFELGRGNRLELREFGVFEPKIRAPRIAKNPRTLVRVEVPAKNVVKFKAGRLMQKSVDGAVIGNHELRATPQIEVKQSRRGASSANHAKQ